MVLPTSWFETSGLQNVREKFLLLQTTKFVIFCYSSTVLGCSVISNSLWPMDYSLPGSFVHRDFPGKNTGVGGGSLLQGISPTLGSNPRLPHCRQILYHVSHQRSPRILEWVAYPFSRGSSQPRNQNEVSCIVGGYLTSWATSSSRELI